MAEDNLFSTNDAVLSNLNKLSCEHSIIGEQRLLELYDVALPMAERTLELMGDGLDCFETLSVLKDGLALGEYPLSDETSDGSRQLLECGRDHLRRSDRIMLIAIYLSALRDLGSPVTDRDFLPSVDHPETFTYVRNGLSDEAYDVFSQDFTDPKVRYSATFKECALALSSGDVSYCLLPLEERGGVRLHTVSEIIFRHDFRINSVTPVFGQDGSADMKYALLSRSFTVPEREKDDDLYLEIRLGADNASLSDVLGAVDGFGMSVYRLNTLTFDTEGETETYFSAVIKDSGCGFAPILTYLALFIRDFVPVGIYKNLE